MNTISQLILGGLVSFLLSSPSFCNPNYSALYSDAETTPYETLVLNIKGYVIPTLATFKGWIFLNHTQEEVQTLTEEFAKAGIVEQSNKTMPLHLILLQGTSWVLDDTATLSLPKKENLPNMIRTVAFIQQYIEPKTGPLIPVSGERSTMYNASTGEGAKTQHMQFCALDLIPVRNHTREELHNILWEVYHSIGAEHKMGLGLYPDVRFHIDTCGYQHWSYNHLALENR